MSNSTPYKNTELLIHAQISRAVPQILHKMMYFYNLKFKSIHLHLTYYLDHIQNTVLIRQKVNNKIIKIIRKSHFEGQILYKNTLSCQSLEC